MLFNSLAFLAFFPAVVVVYWLLPQKFRNVFLLVASYYFYMNWEPIYALLILFSTCTTWATGLLIEKYPSHRKATLWANIAVNLGVLFLYKYAGFANQVVHDLLSALGASMEVPDFSLLLPVGISFYTFQAIGYSIDVFRGTLHAERNFLTYALFVSFFPQLVAGPIERASNLLPQFHRKHFFGASEFIRGIQMMLWGYFMKLCIAENVSTYVDAVFNNLGMHNGTSVALAAVFFTFQIFCDFGGYSLIAIGCAHCMGFTLMQNFRQPYMARSIKDFWRRWHISLTTWFTDYVYIPLGGNRCSKTRHKCNILTTFLVSGLWHGANYTFVVWGAYHGLLQVIQVKYTDFKKKHGIGGAQSSRVAALVSVIVTFVLVTVGWIIFRANTMSDAVLALTKLVGDYGPLYTGAGKPALVLPILLIGVLMCREMILERRKYSPEPTAALSRSEYVRSMVSSAVLLLTILLCGNFEGGQFIYFQF